MFLDMQEITSMHVTSIASFLNQFYSSLSSEVPLFHPAPLGNLTLIIPDSTGAVSDVSHSKSGSSTATSLTMSSFAEGMGWFIPSKEKQKGKGKQKEQEALAPAQKT
jgi:hypothetical protein